MENFSHHLWIGFIGGLLAFTHCIGMCGGFVLHLSRETDRRGVVYLNVLWHFGRISTYIFLGAVAGFTGGVLEGVLIDYTPIQNILGFVTGLFILVMGINLLGLLPTEKMQRGGLTGAVLADFCSRLKNTPSAGSTFFLGMITGCLPCPIILAFLAYAVQSASVQSGMATMVAVGCGTMLPLLLLGVAARWVQLRDWGARAGGVVLIVLGISTILRGTAFYHSILGSAGPAHIRNFSHGINPACSSRTHTQDVHH